MLWRETVVEGRPKPTKVPFTVLGHKASHSDPKHWSVYEACAARLEAGGYDGIGFVLQPADQPGEPEIIFVDLDQCRDPATGDIEPWATEIIDRLNSYSEVSPSGTGVHVFIKGVLPSGLFGGRADPIEVYAAKRFSTITGNWLEEYPDEIVEAQEALEWLLVYRLGKNLKPSQDGGDTSGELPAILEFPQAKHEAPLDLAEVQADVERQAQGRQAATRRPQAVRQGGRLTRSLRLRFCSGDPRPAGALE